MVLWKSNFGNKALSPIRCISQIRKKKLARASQRFISSGLPIDAKNYWKEKFEDCGIVDANESVKWIEDHLIRSENGKADILHRFNELCERRFVREPLQYVIGEWDFRDITLKLRPPVFIPRPETEGLIEFLNQSLRENDTKNILEVGCGSGAISLALAKEFKNVFCTAIDISEDAVNLAQENCARLQLSSKLTIIHSSFNDFACQLNENTKFDVIVSNPPYVPTEDMERLQPEISQFEDLRALHGGESGLDLILEILSSSKDILSKNSDIWLEVDSTHPLQIEKIVKDKFPHQLCYMKTHYDIFKRPRFCHLMTVN